MVSIIIPVYNRAKFISKTLDSLIRQTYENWECVIVDDCSTDRTLEVLEKYQQQDVRFKYFIRPKGKAKGANGCRNFGFGKSSGKYIIWFDSDDLMTPDHIESKLYAIQEQKLNFIVSRTQNFENGKLLDPYHYEKKEYGIKASDFILLKIHWYTYDVMLKREVAEKIEWNEKMKSWQDYNYFCKMLLITENGEYLDQILTHRRIHSESIQKSLTKDSRTFNSELLENRVLTYNDIWEDIDAFTRNELVFGMMNLCFELSKMQITSRYLEEVEKMVKNQLGVNSRRYFKMAIISATLSKKGYFFLNKAKGR
ncbi:glycosyltransferase family 2 protein [Zunongwangia sp. F363]|uniref:Glycosyltransferase family 2 protein n=1 Tax=Autumnicola tepida TaxID=3075595 RepID=A0ABU3C9N8_9FLAO|nr:glycosyltransferase family 2 protein [Zunongwangia sp. F363]MDT0643050.1 glycosyltransferase family 2 protein [Zunongwangia sp. F363]